MKKIPLIVLAIALQATLCTSVFAAKPRARDLGIPFDGAPGSFNAITDVNGVAVGYSTLISGQGAHAVRTGVTAVVPRGKDSLRKPVFAGIFSLNGNGEMTGTHWIEEAGLLEGPVMITNTHSVGLVRDAVIQWRIKQGQGDGSGYWWSLPVVAETWDGELSDINGFHVKAEHVFAAIDGAQGGAVAEGSVGGGTGMICHEFKGGTGTSSRVTRVGKDSYTVGALVQANYGIRSELRVAGVPVGKYLQNDLLRSKPKGDDGSIIIAVATDAPLMPHQLKRLARRAAMGLARNGSYAGNGSGDIFIAFSTANGDAMTPGIANVRALSNDDLDPLFLATAQAVEESVINALIAAETMTGMNGTKVVAIDHKALQKVLQDHGRLNK